MRMSPARICQTVSLRILNLNTVAGFEQGAFLIRAVGTKTGGSNQPPVARALASTAQAQVNEPITFDAQGLAEGNYQGQLNITSNGGNLILPVRILVSNTVGVDDNVVELPRAFRLDQNYPNPFNPETSIRYALPFAANVSLLVFDLSGRRVANLEAGINTAGEHVFRVKGANSDGVWNAPGAAINVVIAPPFWKTWWFRVLALAAGSLIVWGAYRYRVNQLLAMERLRTRLAADLHDELAGNLSSIAMFGKIVQDEAAAAGEKKAAGSEMLKRMIALSQESVTAIREIIWAIDPQPETIHDLLLRVRDLAVNACRAQNMILKFEAPAPEHLPAKNLSPERRK